MYCVLHNLCLMGSSNEYQYTCDTFNACAYNSTVKQIMPIIHAPPYLFWSGWRLYSYTKWRPTHHHSLTQQKTSNVTHPITRTNQGGPVVKQKSTPSRTQKQVSASMYYLFITWYLSFCFCVLWNLHYYILKTELYDWFVSSIIGLLLLVAYEPRSLLIIMPMKLLISN